MDVTEGDMAGVWAPEACTLPTVERPVRLAEFDELFWSVRSVELLGAAALRLALEPDPAVAGRAADLVSRETRCCSFFTFTLTVTAGSSTLDVSAPLTHAEVVAALAERAAAGMRVARS